MGRIRFSLAMLSFLVLGFAAQAQDRYAVYFKFKPQTTFSLSKPQDFLTQKALDRRTRERIQADSLDLPVASKYVDQVAALSNYVLYTSKWMNAAVLVTDKTKADQLAKLPFVSKVELVAKSFLAKPNARIRYKVFASTTLETKDRKSVL